MAESLAESIAEDLMAPENSFLILPGGSSPQGVIKELARQDLLWDQITITTTDERRVPMEDAQSNAGQVKRLFAQEGIEVEPLWLGEAKIEDLSFPASVTVLGMGPDGHFASLFADEDMGPGKDIIEATASFQPYERLSLTLEALLDCKRLILLVPDQEKWTLCQSVLAGENSDLPIARLFQAAGSKLELHIIA